MKLRLLTIAHKTPSWVSEGYQDYAKRFPPTFPLELVEVAAEKRFSSVNIDKIVKKESEKLLSHTKPNHQIITLDVNGKSLSSVMLMKELMAWQQLGYAIDFLIGGPDGLSDSCLKKANFSWSLSPLTFPHFLVKLIVAEQLYRAYSMITNHPYHR